MTTDIPPLLKTLQAVEATLIAENELLAEEGKALSQQLREDLKQEKANESSNKFLAKQLVDLSIVQLEEARRALETEYEELQQRVNTKRKANSELDVLIESLREEESVSGNTRGDSLEDSGRKEERYKEAIIRIAKESFPAQDEMVWRELVERPGSIVLDEEEVEVDGIQMLINAGFLQESDDGDGVEGRRRYDLLK